MKIKKIINDRYIIYILEITEFSFQEFYQFQITIKVNSI